ncbi:hypothetical protein TIFTF001_012808 [Ficus carica]|uniref:RING-type E3 ubiquitin transferase n=1 Tax=Ficus carica TaxID=3494 RepID=A0AA88D5G6_FICCA|nr:hypothetical protein TIFTF001_012808 [Ficus carica]
MGRSDDDDYDEHKHRLDVSHKVTLAAVSSLFAVTLLVILFFLYMKYRQNRRQQRRRIDFVSRLISSHTNASNSNSDSAPSDHPSHKNAVGGLDPTVINSLPEFVYKPSAAEEALECSVCLAVVTEEAKVRLLPNCGHVFHVDCVDMWLGSHSTCPLCRAEVEPTVVLMDQPERGGAAAEQPPTAPPVDEMSLLHGEAQPESKPSGSRLSSFRRMLSRERLSMRSLDSCPEAAASGAAAAAHHDLERQ